MKTRTRIKQYLVAVTLLAGLTSGRAWAVSTGFVDGTITVTPVVTVSLSLAPTTYAFGNLDVNTSSVTGHALVLTNLTGNVGVAVTKQIPSNGGLWVADTSSSTNHYVLSVATSSFAPNPNGSQFSTSGTVHKFGTAVASGGSDTPLRGLAGTSTVDLDAAGGAAPSADLWFKLDMPTAVTASTPQEILVRFTGTAL